jgi:nucleoside-diphosphate-sugar epimerase
MLPLTTVFAEAVMPLSLAIIGAGDLGLRVARLRATLGDDVWAMRRRQLPMPDGVHAVIGDMHQAESLHLMPKHPDLMLFCATPDERTEQGYRDVFLDGLQHASKILQPKRVFFISSTAVYAQNNGQWVDESSEVMPMRFNGKVLQEAEQVCLQNPGNVVLRLSGITGPNRTMLINKALLGEAIQNTWTNRIHIDDAASAVSYLMSISDLPKEINVSDDLPALQIDVVNWIRARQNLPELLLPQSVPTGKKVSNALLKSLGWSAMFPSYKEIYP